MTTLPLRQLLRDPVRVKKLTAGGQEVHITDHGRPLWVVSADPLAARPPRTPAALAEAWEAHFDELLNELPGSGISTARLILDGRR